MSTFLFLQSLSCSNKQEQGWDSTGSERNEPLEEMEKRRHIGTCSGDISLQNQTSVVLWLFVHKTSKLLSFSPKKDECSLQNSEIWQPIPPCLFNNVSCLMLHSWQRFRQCCPQRTEPFSYCSYLFISKGQCTLINI